MVCVARAHNLCGTSGYDAIEQRTSDPGVALPSFIFAMVTRRSNIITITKTDKRAGWIYHTFLSYKSPDMCDKDKLSIDVLESNQPKSSQFLQTHTVT
jgi:hypothetical protein